VSSQSSFDRESFQKLLASAFSVQQSGLDSQSLSALFELQQLIAADQPDVDGVMHLAADRARNVANAIGTAVALLKGDQLAYRAGSGSAAGYVGRRVTAILSVSERNAASSEILRVENAQTDARIEATICREFGANSLLILPIYQEHVVVGVLEVFFDEAHAFQEQELRVYRLLAGLVGEAMSRHSHPHEQNAPALQAVTAPIAIPQITSQLQGFRDEDKPAPTPAREHWFGKIWGAATKVVREMPDLGRSSKTASAINERVRRIPLPKGLLNVAIPALGTALVIVGCWIAHDRPARYGGSLSLERSNAAEPQIRFLPAKLTPTNRASKDQTAGGETAKAPSPAFSRVRVGLNEVDYISEDVTIRHFTSKPALPKLRGGYKQVQVGEDVTVRYFATKAAVVSPARPVPTGAPSVDRSTRVSK
jgi:hypothetical protein